MALNLVARLSLDDRLSGNLNRINSNMNKTENAAKRLTNSVKSFGSSVAKIGGAIGVTAAVAGGFNMIRDSVSSAMSRIDTMEQFDRVMTTLTGSSEKAAAALATTNEAMTGTAYGLDIAAKGVQNFVTRGMEIEKATDMVRIWGDAVAFYGDGSNEQLATVSDALGKMYSNGKIQMDQMNRLMDIGINPIVDYAKVTGRSAEQVQADLTAGRIGAEEFIDTVGKAMMEGTNGVTKIAGAAKDAGATWGSTMANMRAAVTRGVIAIIESIDQMLEESGLPDMRTMVADFGKRFEAALKQVASYIPTVVDWLKRMSPYFPLIKDGVIALVAAFLTFRGLMVGMSIIGTVTKLFKALRAGTVAATLAQLGLNTAMLLNPMTWVVAGIAALVAAGVLLYRNWDTVKAKVTEVWDAVKTKIGGAMDSAKTAVSDFFSPLLDFLDRAKSRWDDFKSSIGGFKMPKIGIPKIFGGGGLIQSNFHGLDRVPSDRYPTLLHRGERVLTRQQADAMDRFSYDDLMGGNTYNNQTYNNVSDTKGGGIHIAKLADQVIVREEADIDRIASKFVQNLIAAKEAGAVMAIEFWISFNNGAEKLRLPVNPPSLSISSPFGNTDVEISQFGEYTVIGERGAAELSFESFFPAHYNETYCEYADFPTPAECVQTIERWRDQRKPLRFVVTGTDVNYAMTIRDFSYEVERAGSPGDIYYSLTMKEYRFLDVSAKPQSVAETPKPADKQRPPVVNKGDTKPAQTYTVMAGDSLSRVFGKEWTKVYEANRSLIGNNPNVIFPGQKLVIPA